MTKEQLKKYEEKLNKLSEREKALRNLYLRGLSLGAYQGPGTNIPQIDMPWLQFYEPNKVSFTMKNESVYDYVFEHNQDNLNNTALEFFGKKITYKKFFEKVDETTKAFLEHGVKKGDVVSFCTATLPETFYAFYALNRIGAVANMIDARVNPSDIKRFIKEANSKMVFYIDLAEPKLNPILNELRIKDAVKMSPNDSLPLGLKILSKIKSKISKKTKVEELKYPAKNWKEFIIDGKDSTKTVPYIEDKLNTPSGVVYTSGTTGQPKGSLMTNKNFLAMVYQNYCANMGWDKNDILLGIMPPFIAYGLVCGFTLPLCNGMRIDIIPKFDSSKFADYILKHKPNHIMGVPSYLDSLTTSKKLKGKNLSFIKTAIVGGDKMVVDSEKKVNEFLKSHKSKAKVSKGYGMTEMSSNAIYTINDDANDLGSVGVPLIGNDFKIVNEKGESLGFNEVGEVCLTGPTIINGYFNNEEETKKSFVIEEGKKWIHTGDYALMDKDGRVYFYDRKKRIIVRSDGHNVWPSRIELIAEEHPDILKCCVTGVKENKTDNGEIPTAFMVVRKDAIDNIQDIIDTVNEECLKHLPERDIALQYSIKEDLPLTSVGKIDYRKLSEVGVEDMKNKKMILARKK